MIAPWPAARHGLKEAWDGLARHPALTLLATVAIGVSIYVFGVFLLLAFNLEGVTADLGRQMQMQVYLRASASPADVEALRNALQADEAVEEVRWVPPEEAERRFKRAFPALGELPSEVGGAIFPPAFEITLRPGYRDPDAVERLVRAYRVGPGVEEVRYDRGWFERLGRLVVLLESGGYGIGTLLLLAVMVTTGAVVRLTVLARREEIDIMRLVGATARFIRGPFLVGAAAQGLLGGLLAAFGLRLTWRLVLMSGAYRDNPFLALLLGHFLPDRRLLVLPLGGALLALAAAALSLRRASA